MFDVTLSDAPAPPAGTVPNLDRTFRNVAAGTVPKRKQTGNAAAVGSVLDAIGNTPTVRLRRLCQRTDLSIFGKLELCNPGGSMKDRPSRAMLEAAIADGRLRPGMTVVESSSGNMGIGLAQACAYYRYRFVCVVDPRTQTTNIDVMRAYGAEIDLVSEPDAASGDFLTARMNRVRQHVAEGCGKVFWPNQYENDANPAAHAAGTARELNEAAGGLDLLLVATSTTGTIGGCLDYFRAESPDTQVVAVDAAGSVLFGGSPGPRMISGLGAGRIPALAESLQPDDVYRVTDLDCVVGCRRLVRAEAILAGGSAGGLVHVLHRLAPTLPLGTRVGMILADGGSRYLHTVYNDDWVESVTGCNAETLEHLVREIA